MSVNDPVVPFSAPLSPRQLLSLRTADLETFPFSASRSRYYYLARNAIWHGVECLGLKAGDVVLVPAYHHGVEVEALLRKGLRLAFYRVDEEMRIDLGHLQSLISPAVRALYVIHYLGFPQPIDRIREIAERNRLLLVEDCALSLFSHGPLGPLGTVGDMSIFCLYKTLPVPHGGMLVFNKDGAPLPAPPVTPDWVSTGSYIANRLLSYLELREGGWGPRFAAFIRTLGRATKKTTGLRAISVDTNLFDDAHVNLGMSWVARHLLRRTDSAAIIAARRYNYEYLCNALDSSVRVQFGELPDGVCPLSFPVLVQDKERVWGKLLRAGVETVNFWSRRHPAVREGEFPEVEFLRRHVLEVPIYQGLRDAHLDHIARQLKEHARW